MLVKSSNQKHSISLRFSNSADLIGEILAGEVVSEMLKLTPGTLYFMGLPTGRTPIPFLKSFVSQISSLDSGLQKDLIRSLSIIVMDDLVDASGKNISPDIEFGAFGFMRKHLLEPLGQFIDCKGLEERIFFPKPGEVGNLKKFVLENGGMPFQMIATDPFEGHVAQNFPNAPFRKTEAEKQVPLSREFIRHNPWAEQYSGVTFDLVDFSEMVAAHPCGRIVVVISGATKRDILAKFFQNRSASEDFPLSYFWSCECPTELHTDQTDVTADITKLS